ncbi:hypothetical protein J2Z19_002641 [Ensifer adhaerens]|uniref:Uncharacterized protein n=1 Tax=Ensifer adhaerens TaxID=106592 RepID=A0ACC5SW92_ENSAD|nr:hypothetical protein [Ensifer adhaerens]
MSETLIVSPPVADAAKRWPLHLEADIAAIFN